MTQVLIVLMPSADRRRSGATRFHPDALPGEIAWFSSRYRSPAQGRTVVYRHAVGINRRGLTAVWAHRKPVAADTANRLAARLAPQGEEYSAELHTDRTAATPAAWSCRTLPPAREIPPVERARAEHSALAPLIAIAAAHHDLLTGELLDEMLIFCATCGQGTWPAYAHLGWHRIVLAAIRRETAKYWFLGIWSRADHNQCQRQR